MNSMYTYDRYSQKKTSVPFIPKSDNWYISASKANENIYFPNLSSYNNWASTCCSDSYNSITSGTFGDYKIKYNKI